MSTLNIALARKDEGVSPTPLQAMPDRLPAGVIELSEDQLTNVNGGYTIKCPSFKH